MASLVAVTRPGLAFLFGLAALLASGTDSRAQKPAKFELRTTAFSRGGNIPVKYTCDGANISPALAWTDPPAGTESFVLIVDDPDAPSGTWVHWVVYDLPATARELAEGQPPG
jgi:phosphatidylethanolamine-binding protein (PEBP) family uncharacterized protein